MSNSNAPFGLRPILHAAGGTPARQNAYRILYSYATAIYAGDLVRSVAAAAVDREIELVPDGTAARVLGVFAGCRFVDNSDTQLWLPYWPGVALADSTKVVEAYVYDDPLVEYVAQMTTFAYTDIGAAFEWNNGTGVARTGRSGGYIDKAATTTPQIRVEGLWQGPDGINLSEIGAYAKVRCRILTQEKAGTLIAH
jgi:hypothetical protein